MTQIQNFIDGKLVPPVNGQYLPNFTPISGLVYSEIPDSDHHDVGLAVAAAERAFRGWSSMPARERSAILLRLADLIAKHSEELAQAETLDSGKPIHHSRTVDIPRAEANIRFFATAILHTQSEAHHTDVHTLNYTNRKPLGVVGCISPWNLPLYLFTWKIAPALATGNCVVAKPSEITPMTAFLFSKLCTEAGLPSGVLNVIHGTGERAGGAITSHDAVKAISFTGGTTTGGKIAALAAPKFKKLSLELGGKNPAIIFSDCDFDRMLAMTVRSSFSNQGQICLCGSRILVEESIYDRFIAEFSAAASHLVPGDPRAAETRMGALVSEGHLNKVLSYVGLAKEEGATVVLGGERRILDGDLSGGSYMMPTILTELGPSCRTNQEEIFGPVVTIQSFRNEEEAIELANSTRYGLSATIWTSNLSRAHRMSASLETGIVWVNTWLNRDLRTPFGGVKDSGVGREGGVDAIRFFTEPQNVCIAF